MNEQKLVLSVSECADLLGVSRPSVYKWINLGTLPHLKLGTRIVIPRAALEKWIERKTTGGIGNE